MYKDYEECRAKHKDDHVTDNSGDGCYIYAAYKYKAKYGRLPWSDGASLKLYKWIAACVGGVVPIGLAQQIYEGAAKGVYEYGSIKLGVKAAVREFPIAGAAAGCISGVIAKASGGHGLLG
jgi:hypothetical protein